MHVSKRHQANGRLVANHLPHALPRQRTVRAIADRMRVSLSVHHDITTGPPLASAR
jgi:hypothetical protein